MLPPALGNNNYQIKFIYEKTFNYFIFQGLIIISLSTMHELVLTYFKSKAMRCIFGQIKVIKFYQIMIIKEKWVKNKKATSVLHKQMMTVENN